MPLTITEGNIAELERLRQQMLGVERALELARREDALIKLRAAIADRPSPSQRVVDDLMTHINYYGPEVFDFAEEAERSPDWGGWVPPFGFRYHGGTSGHPNYMSVPTANGGGMSVLIPGDEDIRGLNPKLMY